MSNLLEEIQDILVRRHSISLCGEGAQKAMRIMERDQKVLRQAGGRIARQNQALIRVCASLTAAISLLERGSKHAASSDKMFDQMLLDYKKALDQGVEVLQEELDEGVEKL